MISYAGVIQLHLIDKYLELMSEFCWLDVLMPCFTMRKEPIVSSNRQCTGLHFCLLIIQAAVHS
jgi:hypothetical protein